MEPHGDLTVQVRICAVGVGDCEKDTLLCIISGRFGITSGTYFGPNPLLALPNPLPAPPPVIRAEIDGATNAPGGLALVTTSCVAPFVVLNGSNASLADLVGTVR